jgi:hypothetical protein
MRGRAIGASKSWRELPGAGGAVAPRHRNVRLWRVRAPGAICATTSPVWRSAVDTRMGWPCQLLSGDLADTESGRSHEGPTMPRMICVPGPSRSAGLRAARRHTRKSPEDRRDGYRTHVAACPETGIITGEQLTKAAGPDNSNAAVAAGLISCEVDKAEVYSDSACGTWDPHAWLEQAGHASAVKPKPLKPAVEGGFTLDDFTADETVGTVACPAGITWPISARPPPLSTPPAAAIRWGSVAPSASMAVLRFCTSTRRCSAPRGPPARARENHKKFRPNVEQVISQVATRGGRRLKLRYLGIGKNNAWGKDRTATINLRNLIIRGLTRDHGAWLLA